MSDKGYVLTRRRRRQREREEIRQQEEKMARGWISTPINYYRRQILAPKFLGIRNRKKANE
jgi:hypothetical protein